MVSDILKQVNTTNLSGFAIDDSSLEKYFLSDSFSKAWTNREVIKQDAQRSVNVLDFVDDRKCLIKASDNTYVDRCKKVLGLKPSGRTVLARMLTIKAAGVSIPQPLASLLFTSSKPQELQVMEFLPNAVTLHTCISQLLKEDLSAIKYLVQGVLQELIKLHRMGRVHGDMKLNNVMLSGNSVYLVDIDGRLAKKQGRLFQKDLARLLVGLIEVKAPQEINQSIVKTYAEAMKINNEKFFIGVSKFVKKIMQRHKDKKIVDSENVTAGN